MDANGLLESALDAAAIIGRPAVSVFAADSVTATVGDLLAFVRIPHTLLRTTTVGRIRAGGFTIRRTGGYPHCSIELGDEPSLVSARALARCFDQPTPNPTARKAR